MLLGIDKPVDGPNWDPAWAWPFWQEFIKKNPGEQIDWWIGHDVTKGHAAVEGPLAASHGQSALIMHMNYAAYQAYKGGVGKLAAEKEQKQRDLFPQAKRCFANGPLLRDALKDMVESDVYMLVPGFATVPVHPSSQCLQLITFGRMDRESDRIKQGGLAVADFASAVKQASSNPGLPEKLKNKPQMRVVGIREPGGKEEKSLKSLASRKAGEQVVLIALPYDDDRSQLLKVLGRANISLMLSWHEGFGLTGWEAVAGEVPLIISQDSGLWQLLKETLGERIAEGYVRTVRVRGKEGGDDAVNFLPEDERAVRDAIIDCAAKLEEARKTAVKLKKKLKKELVCTWENTAKQFLDGLGIELPHSTTPVSPPEQPPPPPTHPVPRSEFIAIPKPSWSEDLAAKGFLMPDSMLLRAESRIVRFHSLREPLRDEIIGWALNPDQLIKLRLQAGEGGAGKTRLLIEVCDRLEHSHGWRAGFVEQDCSGEDMRYALTVLTRLGRRVPEEQRYLRRALERNLTKISEDAVHVGMETGSPLPEILEQVLNAGALRERKQTVNALRVKIPKETLNLRGLKVAILRQSIEFLENKKVGTGAKRDIGLTEGFVALSVALEQAGLLAEAADAASKAKEHAQIVFRSDSENDRNWLAATLNNFAVHHSDVGHFEEALEAAEKAEKIFRGLAEKQPDAYTALWAESLSNLGTRLNEVGRFEEALEKAEKAEKIRRGLAEKQPDAYTAHWAGSLNNLGNRLSDVGRFVEALEKAEKAEKILRGLAEKQPDACTADWAGSLNDSDPIDWIVP